MAKKYKFKITSGIIALITGSILGWYIGSILMRLLSLMPFTMDSLVSNLVYGLPMGISAFFFVWLGIKRPILVESIGFIFSIFVFLQFIFWDFPANDINVFRVTIFLVALGLFLLNVFTGHLRWNSGLKYFKRSVGAK